jgi:two-component system phosphate regulon sensor histidine kinase PhoR
MRGRPGVCVIKQWGRPLVGLVLISFIGLVLWPVFGALKALLAFSALLLLLLLHHLSNLSRLHAWLTTSGPTRLPEGTGVWQDIFFGLSRVMRRQTQIENRLSSALSRFQQAGAALPEGVLVLDEDDRIEWCNPRAEEHFGLDARRDRGQFVTFLIRHPPFVSYLEAGSFHEPLVLRVSRPEGELVLTIQLVPYGGSEKLLLSRDVTRWERLETTRRDFVANVSHELRTPLTVLNGFLETLADMGEADPELLRRSIVLMMEQTVRMHRLVEDLLTLSRLESTHNPPREDFVDVPELAQTLYREALALSAGRHRIALRVLEQGGLRGSAEELHSALGNLISNAVRYTPDGGEIDIGWSKDNGEPVFCVRDTGIGIDPQHIPRLTERFYRVDRSRSRSTGGTGLGLAIAKHVLSRHQAHLDIQSEVGRGSLFRAVFPAARSLSSKDELDRPASASSRPHAGGASEAAAQVHAAADPGAG